MFQIRPHFIELIGVGDHHARGKMEEGREWVTRLDCAPDAVLMIGDTVHDFEVAQAIGVDCVLLARGHQPLVKLATCDAPIFDSLSNALAIPMAVRTP